MKGLSLVCFAQNELAGSVAQKTRFLQYLRSELAAIQAASAPSRAALALRGPPAGLPEEAKALPLPLYVLYSQLLAAEACGCQQPCQPRWHNKTNNLMHLALVLVEDVPQSAVRSFLERAYHVI